MDEAFIALLVCPRCRLPLAWCAEAQELVCRGERLAFPVREGVPVMLLDESRTLADAEEVE